MDLAFETAEPRATLPVGYETPDAAVADGTILDRLASHAEATPRRRAFVFLNATGAPDELTFAELANRVRGLAGHLRERAKPGERALLLYPPGLEFVEAFLACLAAGIVAAPAYPPRRNRSAERLGAILDDCTPTLFLTTEATLPNLGELAQRVGQRRLVATDALKAEPTPPAIPRLDPMAVAFLQYTSGSTGRPRGVAVTHRNIVANERAIQAGFRLSPRSVMVSWLPAFHDMGLIGGVLQPLFVGFPSVLMAPVTFLQEPIRWLRAIAEYGGTTTGAPNFAWDHCVKTIGDEAKRGLDLSGLEVAYNGAEPVRAATIERFAQAFASCGFRKEAFFPCYGLAESTLFVSGGPPLRPLVRRTPTSGGEFVGCGRPAPGTNVAIVDPEAGRRRHEGEVGEIWIASPSVASGYWNRPDESEATFRAALAETGEGPFLRTGDLGFVKDGDLFVTGRIKDMVIIRGRNHYPQDIEQVVERTAPFVRANACAAFELDSDDSEQLAIVVEADREFARHARAAESTGLGSETAAQAEIDRWVGAIRQAVIDEFEIPVHCVAFVRPGSFPRTSSGKVQRRACRDGLRLGQLELVWSWRASTPTGAGAPAAESDTPTATDAAEHALRREVHAIVVRYLAAEVDASIAVVDLDAPLTSVGVDSMGATAIAVEIEKATGVRLTPDAIYDCRTIRQIAKRVAESLQTRVDSGARRVRGEAFVQELIRRDRLAASLRSRNRYFYETPFEEIDGNSAVVGGRRLMMLSSFSYLGLVGHPEVNQASHDALKKHGGGAHGARLLAGTTDLHQRLESEIAAVMGSQDAIVFGTGYVTNLAAVASLVGSEGFVIGDERNHASIADGCRFSGGEFATFAHNDLASLESHLRRARGRNTLVVVDAVYSMEGDVAPVPDIVRLCTRYDALLMVDEAHSLGVLGKTGRGVQEHFGLPPDAIDLKMGTLSKALGSQGGFVAGRQEIVSFLKHNARGFMFSTASPAPTIAAALKGLEILQREPQRVARLQAVTSRFLAGIRRQGFETTATETPIVPLLCKTEDHALEMTARCRERGLYVVPIFYPVVPMNAPRIRITLIATHTDEEIDRAVQVLGEVGREVGVVS